MHELRQMPFERKDQDPFARKNRTLSVLRLQKEIKAYCNAQEARSVTQLTPR